jgi:hypothetical protein
MSNSAIVGAVLAKATKYARSQSAPTIGIDLDNTIICLDRVFHAAALGEGLIPVNLPPKKGEVKRAVINAHGTSEWIRLQGIVYGSQLRQAEPYPGVMSFFAQCRERGIPALIISHKTRYPAAGPKLDMREAALDWLAANGLSDVHVEFTDTRVLKTAAIAARECSLFIDDLPEVFLEPGFPTGTSAILFDPDREHPAWPHSIRATAWAEITASVFTS